MSHTLIMLTMLLDFSVCVWGKEILFFCVNKWVRISNLAKDEFFFKKKFENLKFLVFEWGQKFRLWNYEFLCDIQLIFWVILLWLASLIGSRPHSVFFLFNMMHCLWTMVHRSMVFKVQFYGWICLWLLMDR